MFELQYWGFKAFALNSFSILSPPPSLAATNSKCDFYPVTTIARLLDINIFVVKLIFPFHTIYRARLNAIYPFEVSLPPPLSSKTLSLIASTMFVFLRELYFSTKVPLFNYLDWLKWGEPYLFQI